MSWTSRREARTKWRDICSLSRERRRIAVVEQDQVDVARVVELVGAELAHAEHGEGGGLGIAANAELALAFELQQDRVGQRVEAGGGEAAQRAGDVLERPGAGDVGDGDGEGDAALQPAQGGGDRLGRRAARASSRTVARSRSSGVSDGVRTGAPQIGHRNRVL